MLKEVAVAIRQLRGQWVLAGDWNMTPEVLASSGWLDVIKGTIVAPAAPTCFGSVYDFFIVSEVLAPFVVGCIRLDDAGLHPHWPARLLMRGDGKRFAARKLHKPERVRGIPPAGPLPDPGNCDDCRPLSVDTICINDAVDSWLVKAHAEWSSLSGTTTAPSKPRFKWAQAGGCKAEQEAGACRTSIRWREIARRFDEAAAIADRRRVGREYLLHLHLERLYSCASHFHLDEDRNAAWAGVQAMVELYAAGDTIGIRRLAAILTKKAATIEAALKGKAAASWRAALSTVAPGGTASGAPSRLAYRWIKGTTGWTRSPTGSQDYNDAVPDIDEIDEAPGHLIEPVSVPPRIWAPGSPVCTDVLSDQADTEREADYWAQLWNEHMLYVDKCDPHDTAVLEPLMPWALRQAALSFPAGTGLGADQVAPRAYARLSERLIRALCAILMAIELVGHWPEAVQMVVIVLLPKPDEGRRPIGLFMSLIRVWARARSVAARS